MRRESLPRRLMTRATLPNNGPIQVALAADAGVLRPLAATLASLAQAHPPGELVVSVIHDGLAEADRAQVERGLAERLDVNWIRVPLEELAGTQVTLGLTRATLFRVLLPCILPDVDRLIYLDADVVVAAHLRPL